MDTLIGLVFIIAKYVIYTIVIYFVYGMISENKIVIRLRPVLFILILWGTYLLPSFSLAYILFLSGCLIQLFWGNVRAGFISAFVRFIASAWGLYNIAYYLHRGT